MTLSRKQDEHDEMVKYTVSALSKAEYYSIKADLPSYKNKPDEIFLKNSDKGYLPDITAFKDGVKHIFEIETEDTITIEEIKNKWTIFSMFAEKRFALFIAVVPNGFKKKASEYINELGISAIVVEVHIESE